MFGRSENKSTLVKTTAENRFSLPYLRQLHQQLVANKNVNEENQTLVIEILRIIAEMVVYGDNKSEILFDFFCEKNMLSLFLELMWTEGGCPNAVHIQILQTLSILINCVKNNTSLYYLLSNNYVNEIINFPHNFESDESLRDQFASFMKSLSLRLNKQTVQFFFIEETGAFPLLTRAIEVMYLNDNMVRIASQTTILNIFRVQDFRSRAYALQEEVMFTFFTVITSLMREQYRSLLGLCKQYTSASPVLAPEAEVESERLRLVGIENQMSDLLINSEDWLYYLMDVFDLKIMVLRRALVQHLMDNFIYPVLLPSYPHQRMYVFQPGDSPLESDGSETPADSSVEFLVSITYLAQILRIVSDKMLRRAILTAILHPCSRGCRSRIQDELCTEPVGASQNGSAPEAVASDISSILGAATIADLVPADNDSTIAPIMGDSSGESEQKISHGVTRGLVQPNSYREGLLSLFENSMEKSLVGTNFMRVIADAYLSSARNAGEEETVRAELWLDFKSLQALSVWPVDKSFANDVVHERPAFTRLRPMTKAQSSLPRSRKSWGGSDHNERRRSQSGEDEIAVEPDDLDKPVAKFVIDADILHASVLEEIRQYSLVKQDVPCVSFLETLGDMLASPADYPLCALHEAVHAIYGFAMAAHLSSDVILPIANVWLKYCLDLVGKVASTVSASLIPRLSTPMGDMILNILQEELYRLKGRKWSSVAAKISKEVLLLMPALSSHSRSQSCDLECNVPISQTEAVRREIQVFLLVRSLYNQILRLYSASTVLKVSIDDVTSNVVESGLAGFTDTGLIPTHLIPGTSFDMRGKKFLDAMVYETTKSSTVAQTPNKPGSSSAAGALSPEESSTLLASSIFGFGFLGGAGAAGQVDSYGRPTLSNTKQPKSRTLGEIFFVQSNALFLLVEPRDDEFYVWLATPIHQTDVSVSQSRKKLTVFVRSWERIDHMDLVGSEIESESLPNSSLNSIAPPKKFPELLRPRQQGSLYRLTMIFDTENSCHLAAQHIESKRHKMRTNRLLYLKGILESWSKQDSEHLVNEPLDNIKVN